MPDIDLSRNLYLVLDQGGHASRALVFDAHGECVARSLQTIAVSHPANDRVEHDAEEVVASLLQAIAEVAGALGERCRDIAAAGLATQRSSIVCWDRESGQALTPVISWQDRRAATWLTQFDDHATWIHQTTGLVMSPHYGASKLRWCLDHVAAVADARQTDRLAGGPLASFLLFRLLAEHPLLVDPANAARTLLWNSRAGEWEPDLLQLFGVPRAMLPDCVPTRHEYGTLMVGDVSVPVTHLTGDQPAALFFRGEPDPRSCYINIGTGAFVQRITHEYPRYGDDLLASVVFSDARRTLYALEGTVNGAAKALDDYIVETGLAGREQELGERLLEPLTPPLFLNGVSGLGAPFWIADFPSAFVGGGAPWEKVVAVAESIVFLLQINIDESSQVLGSPKQVVVSGGLSALDGLCQRLSDLSALPIYRPAEREATASGLAFLLAGLPDDRPESVPGQWFYPQANSALEQRFSRWCEAMAEALIPES